MKELILKELVLNRTLDTCNDFVLWADISDLEVLADKIEKAINYTRCSTQLKFNEFADEQIGLDREAIKLVNENFWDLL